MKSDEELLKTFKVEKLDGDIISVNVTESESEEDNNGRQADLLAAAIMEVVNRAPNIAYKFLVDLTLTGTVSYISPHAREVYTHLSKTSTLDRAAIIGHNLMLEIAVNLLMQATGRSQSFKWFTGKEEALSWLKKVKEE